MIYEAALRGEIYNIANQCLLIRRECFDEIGYYDENVRRYVDLEILLRISSKFLFAHLPEPLVNYYITLDSISKKGEEAVIDTWEVIVAKHYHILKKLPGAFAKWSYWIGSFHMRASNEPKGRAYLAKAFRAKPLNPRYAIAYLLSHLGSGAYGFVQRRLK